MESLGFKTKSVSWYSCVMSIAHFRNVTTCSITSSEETLSLLYNKWWNHASSKTKCQLAYDSTIFQTKVRGKNRWNTNMQWSKHRKMKESFSLEWRKTKKQFHNEEFLPVCRPRFLLIFYQSHVFTIVLCLFF